MRPRLTTPSLAERDAWLAQLGDHALHDTLQADLECLHGTEGVAPSRPTTLGPWVRIVAWNVQRGRQPDGITSLLGASHADIALLSELDVGMARTANRDVPADLAAALNAGYAFGIEFIELGLGDEEETRATSGTNERGLHGNAIVTPAELDHVMVVRLGESGGWFDAGATQPRIGGRMAVIGAVRVDGVPVQVASTHLENRGDAACRAGQLEVLIREIDEREPGGPAVIGGDFNTLGAAFEDFIDHHYVEGRRALHPTHFSWPVLSEPLFEVAAARGFSWVTANVAAPTTSHGPDGLPDYVPVKIDWFLVRGLEARRPAVLPAIGPDGEELSDHQAIGVSVRLITA